MYSPTMRLLTVLELLQTYEQISGPEIAQRLEIDVRTVRRYIATLQDMGIPVQADRGPHGAYWLQGGNKLPPLMYTKAEAVAITLGLLAIREFNFPVDVAAVEGALAKTERTVPKNLLHQARSLQEAIIFNTGLDFSTPPDILENDFIVTLSAAVQHGQRVHMRYHAYSGGESQRDFDPYGIVFNEGYWYTPGYCHARQALRTFRVDRMLSVEPIEANFERPVDFNVLESVLNSISFIPGAHPVELLLKTTLEHAQDIMTPITGTFEETDEGIIFRRTVFHLDWIAHTLLTTDIPVVINEPYELHEVMRKLAARALRMAGE
jgi:predicted DNA-binding transcriptional regulator YafY